MPFETAYPNVIKRYLALLETEGVSITVLPAGTQIPKSLQRFNVN